MIDVEQGKGGASMEQEKEASSSQILWIDWKSKFVSFMCAEGFEAKEFFSYVHIGLSR